MAVQQRPKRKGFQVLLLPSDVCEGPWRYFLNGAVRWPKRWNTRITPSSAPDMAHCRIKLFHDWWPRDCSIRASERVRFPRDPSMREAGERIRELARAPRGGLARAN